jgi:hypothetical protein
MVVAAATLAVTGYACALAGVDGVAAIRGMAGHRPTPGKGVVSGISSFVGSSAFAAALSSAASSGGTPSRTLTTRDRQECLPAPVACVDLTQRLPWSQDDGAEDYGPVLPSYARG